MFIGLGSIEVSSELLRQKPCYGEGRVAGRKCRWGSWINGPWSSEKRSGLDYRFGIYLFLGDH